MLLFAMNLGPRMSATKGTPALSLLPRLNECHDRRNNDHGGQRRQDPE